MLVVNSTMLNIADKPQCCHAFARYFLLMSLLFTYWYVPTAHAEKSKKASNYTEQHRSHYLKAVKHIKQGEINAAQRTKNLLGKYPLTSYLDFHLLSKQIYKLKPEQVDNFIKIHEYSWLAERMRNLWVRSRKTTLDYHNFILYFDEDKDTSTKLRCFLAESYFKTGKNIEAVSLAKELWLHPKSQPNECDSVFEQLIQHKKLTESLVLQRFILARKARQYKLSRYLHSLIKSPQYRLKLALVNDIEKRPQQLKKLLQTKEIDKDHYLLINYGLFLLTKKNAMQALATWQEVNSKHSLSIDDNQTFFHRLCGSIKKTESSQYCWRTAQKHPSYIDAETVEVQIKIALIKQDWQSVNNWVSLLNEEQLAKPRWQYWSNRSAQQLQLQQSQENSSQVNYQTLAKQLNYYGLLSSIQLGEPPTLVQKIRTVDKKVLAQVNQLPAIQRAQELRLLGHSLHARQEWSYALQQMDGQQLLAMAQLGVDMQWSYASISAMSAAKYWDELHYRFPINYYDQYRKAIKTSPVDISWLLGVSRKESNFIPDIKSSSGAVGVMQLMPRTAKEVARMNKVKYHYSLLKDPKTNIHLGSAYLYRAYRELGNSVYATAAYNAGISRIKSWLKDGREQLPLDVWLETVPYASVQDYVQSVMLFSVIYADKLGSTSPMMALGKQWFVAE